MLAKPDRERLDYHIAPSHRQSEILEILVTGSQIPPVYKDKELGCGNAYPFVSIDEGMVQHKGMHHRSCLGGNVRIQVLAAEEIT